MREKIAKLVGICIFMQLSVIYLHGHAAVFDNKTSEKKNTLSPGVTHTQESYRTGSIYEAVNLLNINLNDTYTKLAIGVPNPINSLKTTSAMAKENSYLGHRVVGATNAAFFASNGYPANLLALNNEIINYGTIGENYESPTQTPVAFGITKSGQAIADTFQTNVTFSVNGKSYTIDRINNQRLKNKTVLYTASRKRTGTNEWGAEIVVTKASKKTNSLYFGDKITGTVDKVTSYHTPGNSEVPSDGFVISVQNEQLATELSNSIKPGTPIEISIQIEQKWQDAEFILAAGPLLVKNGKVNISMPTNAAFVSARHPRTAVAVDATGKNVFLVTVDGRRNGHSNGTSLQDLATYLISKGAMSAINLDGGGSTTMVTSQPGTLTPRLVNRPSDSSERRVSAILQAISVAPPGKAKLMKLNATSMDAMVNTSFRVNVTNAMDVYLNPLKLSANDINWKVEGNIGKMEGNTFTATRSGTGKIIATSGDARAEMKVKVIDSANAPIILNTFDSATNWNSTTARAKASIAKSSKNEVNQIGKSALKLSYDFTTKAVGTKAAYVVAKRPLSMIGTPDHLGVWVYGDGKSNWLRGNIIDGSGKRHTINFTSERGLNWTGWKYVKATIAKDLPLPLTFERIYIAQPHKTLQAKGKLFFSDLQAVYSNQFVQSSYVDVATTYWAYPSIDKLRKKGLITGYPNGTFQAEAPITRAEAATLIARALNLKPTKASVFSDVKKSHFAYNEINAVAEKDIVIGRKKTKFYPDGELTRAEMATILKRAYHLQGTAKLTFTDVSKKHWAYQNIQTLIANNLTNGYPDNTFQPDKNITRAEFASLLERTMK